ncbi:WXG100 family type VII secretion target [Nocardia xishanensis]|uniref:WXG100 family type VII secretion target n=1 Tax=Nocardia xishanensis TaxID=238964 RepID=A0ABW7X4F8_9NOCA
MISANFDGVADGARLIIDRARNLEGDLIKFNNDLKAFFDTQGGDAKAAFEQYQAIWNDNVKSLNDTLAGAGRLVDTGNSELQGTDSSLSRLFQH